MNGDGLRPHGGAHGGQLCNFLVTDVPRRCSHSWTGSGTALAAIFFLNGVVLANWYPRIPTVKAALGLTESQLGLALLGVAVGSLLAMPLTALATRRLGPKPVIRFTVTCYSGALPLVAFATNGWTLGLALLQLGAAVGALDVAMNAAGTTLERHAGQPVMLPTLHGVYSVGVLCGTLCGGAAEAGRVSLVTHFAMVAGLTLALGAVAGRLLADENRSSADSPIGGSGWKYGGRPLLFLSITGFCALFIEGGIINWSGVYVTEEFRAAPGIAASGLIGFSITMTAVRLVGGYLAKRLGALWLVRVGALVATGGIVVVLVADGPLPAVLGFTVIGAGIANIFPLVLSSCGRQPGVSSATAIAAVSTVGYLGHLSAPAAIGIYADWTSLTSAVGLIAIFTVAVAFFASPVQTEGLHTNSINE